MSSYQYTIKKQIKNGLPFNVATFDYLDICLIHLNDCIKKDKHYKRPFYVYNSFFKNEFPEEFAKCKYTVLMRKVGDWEDFKDNSYFFI